ncbi:hypothetical protein [Streptococcus merionis]|uniref:Uncharacterized protein n=1 Tax=Streptococcus merionis TaxID=400065 RepID=A0A239SRB1_9STRE|nr:hypothetical protein [Streptococcus merionis]SNU87779.1 Uncharacterised protein [Streptococcus merionis]
MNKEQISYLIIALMMFLVGITYLLSADKTLGIVFVCSGTTFLALSSMDKKK